MFPTRGEKLPAVTGGGSGDRDRREGRGGWSGTMTCGWVAICDLIRFELVRVKENGIKR
jgi:hypothetical protein